MDQHQYTKDTLTLCAELEGAAAILYTISEPISGGDNRMSEKVIGEALNGVAMFLDRICADVGSLPIAGKGDQA